MTKQENSPTFRKEAEGHLSEKEMLGFFNEVSDKKLQQVLEELVKKGVFPFSDKS